MASTMARKLQLTARSQASVAALSSSKMLREASAGSESKFGLSSSIIFYTGAGIEDTAGLPDFPTRTALPGTVSGRRGNVADISDLRISINV